ncbi:redoxin domain-containing protein [Patescibacteria group bacterium]|nr:redoxin domain-containing protein [Patescibacteria group bacterium]MBU1957126.1 redoxin domain-containing protein [bacterium]
MKRQWSLKNSIKELVITLLMLFVISMLINYIRQPEIGEDIYRYELIDTHNSKIHFYEYQDEPLLVHFWATWCPTCKFEASNIERIAAKYNVITIAINSGSNEEINSYMKAHGLSYKVINDQNGAIAKKFNIEAYPTTLIYNGEGLLKFTEVGYSTTLGLETRLGLIN